MDSEDRAFHVQYQEPAQIHHPEAALIERFPQWQGQFQSDVGMADSALAHSKRRHQ